MRNIALVICLLLAACGPQYQTQYNIIPPQTESGRMCANNCLLMEQTCRQSCSTQKQQCDLTNKLQAQNDYQQYVIERQREGKAIKKTASDFTRYSGCPESDSCEANCQGSYRICHTNCGGQVLGHTVCVANCSAATQQIAY